MCKVKEAAETIIKEIQERFSKLEELGADKDTVTYMEDLLFELMPSEKEERIACNIITFNSK